MQRTLQEGFQQLDGGLGMLAHWRHTPAGTVRINASQHAIDEVLLPKLAGFGQRYPDVKLELISENRFVDIIGEQFDAGVRLGDEVDEGMVAVRIAPDMEMAVVGTPEHYRRYGFPQTPQDLAAHPCIAYQFANGGLYHWEFTYEGRAFKHPPVGQWVFNDSYMEAAAAKAGLGLAYVPVAMVAEALENGRLIRVLKPFSHDVFQDFIEGMANVNCTVSVGRAVVQDEFWAARERCALLAVNIVVLPESEDFRLALRQIAAHREISGGQIQSVFIVSHVVVPVE